MFSDSQINDCDWNSNDKLIINQINCFVGIEQIELQDIDFTTFINGAPPEKADKDLKREGGEGDEEGRGITSGATTKMEKKRKRDDSKVDDDATGAHRVFCRPRRQRAVVQRRGTY